MSLETATYISQLNPANPPSGDPVANAADHLRLIKSVLQNQFPNLTASAVTATGLQLGGFVPTGGVIMWSGSIASIPSGWGLCNGWTYSKLDGSGNIVSPNLGDRFIVGAGYSYAVGATGGAMSHQHGIGIGGTALTVAQLPYTGLTVYDSGHTHGVSDPGHTHPYQQPDTVAGNGGTTAFTVGSSVGNTGGALTGVSILAATTGITAYLPGSNQTHTHSATSDWQLNLPPYYALAFIVRL